MVLKALYVRALRTTLLTLFAAQIAALVLLASAAGPLDVFGVADDAPAASEGPPPASSTSNESTGESPPEVTAVITGPEGSGGWYVGDVTLEWEVSDDETPVTSTEGCDPTTVTADTTGDTFTCTATSDGGQTTSTATIARDATAPTDVTVTPDRAPDADDTYTAPFTATWSGTDETSGIATCTETTYQGPDTDAGELEGTCTDAAGNVSDPVTFAFAFDATAPIVTGTPDRAPDHDGWYNDALTVTWTADDPDAACDDPVVYDGPDSPSATVTGTCTDPAGNAGTGEFTFAFDASAPLVTITTPAADAVYLLNEPADVDFACSDETAEIASCVGTLPDGSALDTDTVGDKTFTVVATDAAGNEASLTHAYAVRYADGTPCRGGLSHQILEPIAADGSSMFKQNRTVPAKFRVCDFFGVPVATDAVVQGFRLTSVDDAATDQAVPSTSAHDEFRTGNGLWIFNIDTKPYAAGSSYGFTISLDDGTAIEFGFRLR